MIESNDPEDVITAKQMLMQLTKDKTIEVDIQLYEALLEATATTPGVAPELAIEIVETMIEQSMPPRSEMYIVIIERLAAVDQLDKALNLVSFLCSSPSTRRLHLQAKHFSPLIRSFASSGNTKKILEVVDMMKQALVQPDDVIATSAVFALVNNGNFNQAWDIVLWAKGCKLEVGELEEIIRRKQKSKENKS